MSDVNFLDNHCYEVIGFEHDTELTGVYNGSKIKSFSTYFVVLNGTIILVFNVTNLSDSILQNVISFCRKTL